MFKFLQFRILTLLLYQKPASLESNHDVREEGESQSGDSKEGDDDASVASIYKIAALGDSDDKEDKCAAMTPETERKVEQAARTRKSRKKKLFVKHLRILCSICWLCHVDDTPAAIRKTTICADPNPDHLPHSETRKSWTRHDVTLSKLFLNYPGEEFRARHCHIELSDILTRAGAQRFLDNGGFPADLTNDRTIARCRKLVPICPTDHVILPRIEGVREEAFTGQLAAAGISTRSRTFTPLSKEQTKTMALTQVG